MTRKRQYHQGVYEVKNPEKYMGDATAVRYRSGWELFMFGFCDSNINVLTWASEEIIIPYYNPGDQKHHRYFPDIFIEFVDVNNKKQRQLIEIKPLKETRPSRSRNPNTRAQEMVTFQKNSAKWKAAKIWCIEHKMEFKIITEKDLFKLK